MKIAVTAQAANLHAPVDPRFGRAGWFILYDNVSGDWQTVENARSIDLAQGAGIQAAQTVAGVGADILLTGHCGPKAFRALQAAGIEVVTGAAGTVAEALSAYAEGRLQPAAAADVEGHW